MTAREGMAYGRPVVVTTVGGLADLGGGAVLVPPHDPRALRAEVERLLSDPTERERLGRAARESAQRFSRDAEAEALVAVYRRFAS